MKKLFLLIIFSFFLINQSFAKELPWKNWEVVESGEGWSKRKVPEGYTKFGYKPGEIRVILHERHYWASIKGRAYKSGQRHIRWTWPLFWGLYGQNSIEMRYTQGGDFNK